MFAVCLNEEAKKMAPPSGCYGDAAFLQHVQNRPLDGQVVRSSKSEETSALTPQPAQPIRQRAMIFNQSGKNCPTSHKHSIKCRKYVKGGAQKKRRIKSQITQIQSPYSPFTLKNSVFIANVRSGLQARPNYSNPPGHPIRMPVSYRLFLGDGAAITPGPEIQSVVRMITYASVLWYLQQPCEVRSGARRGNRFYRMYTLSCIHCVWSRCSTYRSR
jgi:hypothetical protein